MGNTLVGTLAVIGGLITVLAAAASAWAYFKSKQMQSTLDLLATANSELRGIVQDYQSQVAGLKGQVEAMKSEVVLGLVSVAQEALKEAITEAIREGFRERGAGHG